MKSLTIQAPKLPDAETVSRVIFDSLRFTNAADYPPDIIMRVAENFSPASVTGFIVKRRVFVALIGARIVGTASLDGATVKTVFVAPDVQRRGIGARLMEEIDRIARESGLDALTVPSSITAEASMRGFVSLPCATAIIARSEPSSWSAGHKGAGSRITLMRR